MTLQVHDCHFSYGRTSVLQGVQFSASEGEYCVVLGRSGSGKSTLLRLIAGLLRPQTGRITVGQSDWTDTPPQQRDVAMMFQDDQLYPHKTLRQNLQIAKQRSTSPLSIESIASSLKIDDLLDRRTDQISGGQQRRAALAKTLLRGASVCLLDEPLAAVDSSVRWQWINWFVRHRHDSSIMNPGSIYLHVTHDGEEAMALADRMIVLGDGKVLQSASPRELYERPSDPEVALALGSPPANLVEASVFLRLSPQADSWLASHPETQCGSFIAIRPEAMTLLPVNEVSASDILAPNEGLVLDGELESARFVSGRWWCRVRSKIDDEIVFQVVSDQLTIPPGALCRCILR